MTVVKMETVAFAGIEALPVEVEVKITSGLPRFVIVGLPDAVVSESKIRISAALSASLPAKVITVNLSPASVKKVGSHYDLPIALCLLAALGIIPEDIVRNNVAFGELSLDGRILPSHGVLLASIYAQSVYKGIICSVESAREARLSGAKVLPTSTLAQFINYCKGQGSLSENPLLQSKKKYLIQKEYADFAQVKGQESAKRALEIAAAGGHHVLLVGSPGAGKSMLASRFSTILPEMDDDSALESTIIHNLVGKLPNNDLIRDPPFRSPHHSASMVALTGGGSNVSPGEISLSHGGVLFLDEFTKFSTDALQSLRQPMESGEISLARANASYTYPARFQLIAAMNPCRCGNYGEKKCAFGEKCSKNYWEKISGPLLNRFDLCVHVQRLKPWELCDMKEKSDGKTSEQIKSDVFKCQQMQRARQGCLNSHLKQSQLEDYVKIAPELKKLTRDIVNKYELTARGYYRMLKVARTIADLQGIYDDKNNILDNAGEDLRGKANAQVADAKGGAKCDFLLPISKEDILEAASFRFMWDFG